MQPVKNNDEINIFSTSDYRTYLMSALPTSGPQRGIRTRLAQAIGCHPAFISQVLNGNGDFTLEQAFTICRFLELDKDETHYLLLLIQFNRAGTEDLRRHFQAEIQSIQKSREQIKERLKVGQLMRLESQLTYYSSWLYVTVHIMTSVPHFQKPESIARHLGLPLDAIQDSLAFLVDSGLVVHEGDRFVITSKRIHIGTDSPLLIQHHKNWRLRTMQALEKREKENLHYSSVISLSEADVLRIKEVILKALEHKEAIVPASKEEAVFCLAMDFFRI